LNDNLRAISATIQTATAAENHVHVEWKTTLPLLDNLTREDLQTLARQHGIDDSLTNYILVKQLSDILTNKAKTIVTDTCCICVMNPSSVIILPCTHICVREDFATKQAEHFTTCPICRQTIMQESTATTGTNKRQRTI
jgi:hypothetical protein